MSSSRENGIKKSLFLEIIDNIRPKFSEGSLGLAEKGVGEQECPREGTPGSLSVFFACSPSLCRHTDWDAVIQHEHCVKLREQGLIHPSCDCAKVYRN